MYFKNKDKVFHRIGDLVDESVERIQDVADDLEDRVRAQAGVVSRRARAGWREGKDRMVTAEEQLVRTVKAHPVPFILAAMGLLGLVIGAAFYEYNTRRTPGSEE